MPGEGSWGKGLALEPNRRVWVSSKWLVFKRPSRAGFERPLTVGAGDHLQAIADLGREVLPAQMLKLVAGRFVELDVDHTTL